VEAAHLRHAHWPAGLWRLTVPAPAWNDTRWYVCGSQRSIYSCLSL